MVALPRVLPLLLLALCALCQEAHDDHEGQHAGESTDMLTVAQVWGFGILAGIGISLIGFVAAIILVIAKKFFNQTNFTTIIKFFFSLAFGALLGDAVVHILAQAYANTLTDNKIVSLIFILAIVLFLLVDRLMHSLGIAHSHWINEECKSHSHENENEVHPEHSHMREDRLDKVETAGVVEVKKEKLGNASNDLIQNPQLLEQNETSSEKEEKGCLSNLRGKGSSGYMNLIGSLIHNFIDGLALGVAFATGNRTEIIPVIVAIIAHEIPRELGDVAVLLKADFSETQTVLCNGFINFMSMIGVIIGLAVVNIDDIAKNYIMVFVAGNFIYIAADIWQNLFKARGSEGRKQNVVEFVGAGIGIGAMFGLTYLEAGAHNH